MTVEKRNNNNARQIKAARALLDWSQEELADVSGLSIATIRKIEAGAISPRDKTMGAIVSSLEEAGRLAWSRQLHRFFPYGQKLFARGLGGAERAHGYDFDISFL